MNPWNEDAKFRSQCEAALVGKRCLSVDKYGPNSWRFEFEGRTYIDAHCTWRIIANARIALADSDHEQQFGLLTPLDGRVEAVRLLTGPIEFLSVREVTSDLLLRFQGGTILEILTNSSGYESWQCASINGLKAVVQGGGNLVYWYRTE